MSPNLLVTGASGQLGGYLLRTASRRAIVTAGWSGHRQLRLFDIAVSPVDLCDPDLVARSFHAQPPDFIIHAAAVSNIADCLQDPRRAERVNVTATGQLVELAARHRARLVFVSTDLVFNGEKGDYAEDDPTDPLSTYARTKVAAERLVLQYKQGLVARVSLLFGPSLVKRPSFFDTQVAALQNGEPLRLFTDEWRTPLSLQTAAEALLHLAEDDLVGILHLGGPERMSRFEMGQRLAQTLGVTDPRLQPTRQNEVDFAEPRPRDVSLNSSRWRSRQPNEHWPAWDEAVKALPL